MVKGSLDTERRCFTCSQGPHRNEKLQWDRINMCVCVCVCVCVCAYLPRLQTLPSVKRMANLRALSTSIGESAIAYSQGRARVWSVL